MSESKILETYLKEFKMLDHFSDKEIRVARLSYIAGFIQAITFVLDNVNIDDSDCVLLAKILDEQHKLRTEYFLNAK